MKNESRLGLHLVTGGLKCLLGDQFMPKEGSIALLVFPPGILSSDAVIHLNI